MVACEAQHRRAVESLSDHREHLAVDGQGQAGRLHGVGVQRVVGRELQLDATTVDAAFVGLVDEGLELRPLVARVDGEAELARTTQVDEDHPDLHGRLGDAGLRLPTATRRAAWVGAGGVAAGFGGGSGRAGRAAPERGSASRTRRAPFRRRRIA